MTDIRLAAQEGIRDLRSRIRTLDKDSLDLVLTGARSHYAWTDQKVDDALLRQVFDIAISGPTSMNTCPMRVLFVKSPEGKDKIAKSLKPANVAKVMGAPVTAIIGYDPEFWTELPKLFPHEDRRPFFQGKEAHCEATAFRNGSLQGAYFMIAARAIGLDCGPISGFSNEVIDEEFFADSSTKSNFLCNLGYADETALFQKLPRFEFDDVCEII